MIGKFVPALAVAIPPAAAVVDGSPTDNANLATILDRVVVNAPSEYASLRGALVSEGDTQNVYAPDAIINTRCGVCAFADEFGNASYHEVWTYTLTWRVPTSWNDAKTAAFVERMLRPNVSGYTLSRATKDGKTTFDWEKKTNRTWIYAATLGAKDHGFLLRVGYYPPKESHIVQYSRGLGAAEKEDLESSVAALVRIGTQNAGKFRGASRKINGRNVFRYERNVWDDAQKLLRLRHPVLRLECRHDIEMDARVFDAPTRRDVGEKLGDDSFRGCSGAPERLHAHD